jgi:hypothetical protein
VWFELQSGSGKPAVKEAPTVVRDGVAYLDNIDKWVDGRWVPGRKPKLLVNGGEKVIDPFPPEPYGLGDHLNINGSEEDVELGPHAHLLFSGDWHIRKATV